MDLGAVQDLLELLVSWHLGFHSYLKDKIGKSSCSHCHLISTDCHLTTSLQLDPTAVPLGWVFLVSTQTTLSFSSELNIYT